MMQVTEYDDSDVSPAIGDWLSVSLVESGEIPET